MLRVPRKLNFLVLIQTFGEPIISPEIFLFCLRYDKQIPLSSNFLKRSLFCNGQYSPTPMSFPAFCYIFRLKSLHCYSQRGFADKEDFGYIYISLILTRVPWKFYFYIIFNYNNLSKLAVV